MEELAGVNAQKRRPLFPTYAVLNIRFPVSFLTLSQVHPAVVYGDMHGGVDLCQYTEASAISPDIPRPQHHPTYAVFNGGHAFGPGMKKL